MREIKIIKRCEREALAAQSIQTREVIETESQRARRQSAIVRAWIDANRASQALDRQRALAFWRA